MIRIAIAMMFTITASCIVVSDQSLIATKYLKKTSLYLRRQKLVVYKYRQI